jgi:hypothetical protein
MPIICPSIAKIPVALKLVFCVIAAFAMSCSSYVVFFLNNRRG